MKKDQGSMMRIIPSIFTIAAVSVILVFYMGWMANVEKKDAVRQIARSYILKMETEGRLNGTMENNLRRELAEKGMEQIDLSGTTMSEVDYGNRIFLCIQGNLRIHEYRTVGFLRLNRVDRTIPINIQLESTAKH